ncbi:MAG: Hsp20/alpha crystallin family protein [Planctomycetota bacterium]|nr:Hsp20/alpha crystallin family protein [Planctomycetota bacterium]
MGSSWPRIDLEETDDEVVVTADVPSLEAEDIEVTLGESSLTIKGAKTTELEERKRDYNMMETHSGSFYRTIQLPAEVNADRVEARCRNGRLKVTLPKTEAGGHARRRIEVK